MLEYSEQKFVEPDLEDVSSTSEGGSKAEWYGIATIPEAYFLVNRLRSKEIHDLADFKSRVPLKYHELLNKVLNHLEKTAVLKIENGNIILLKREFFFNKDLEYFSSFIPELNHWATKVAIDNMITNKKFNNNVHYYTLSRDKETLIKLKKIIRQADAEIRALTINQDNLQDISIEEAQYVCLLSAGIGLK